MLRSFSVISSTSCLSTIFLLTSELVYQNQLLLPSLARCPGPDMTVTLQTHLENFRLSPKSTLTSCNETLRNDLGERTRLTVTFTVI
jgi:hypothetical protein